MLHELKGPGPSTPSSVHTPTRSDTRVNGSGSSPRRASAVGVGGKGTNMGTGASPVSNRNQSPPGPRVPTGHTRSCPMLAPFEGTRFTAPYVQVLLSRE